MIDECESGRIISDIRQVLLNVWDPIGVSDVPECSDEYDCCLGGVYDLLANGSSDEDIADYLWKRANHHMGCSISKESMMPTVAALRRISLS